MLTISDKKNILPREFWETSWNILEQVPNNLEPQSPDVLQSQKALVKTISFVYSKEKSQFNLEDIKRMLRIFRKLNLVPNESSLEISSLQQISYETIKTVYNFFIHQNIQITLNFFN